MSNKTIKFTHEDLASVLVPETLKENSKEFYDLIKAFCKQLMNTKEYYEDGYDRLINIDKVTNEEIIKVYIDTYVKTLNIDSEQENVVLIKDLIKISKDLSVSKGTVYLFNLLASILKYLLREVNTSYDTLVAQLDNPSLTDAEREAISEQIENQKSYNDQLITVKETSAYRYNIYSILTQDFVEKHIIPFCHPTGWIYTFYQTAVYVYIENLNAQDSLSMYSTIKIPVPVVGDDFSELLFTPLCPNIFDYYYGDIDLGPENQWDELYSKTYNTSRLYISNGRVYYALNSPIVLSDVANLVVDDITATDKQAFYYDATTDNSIMYRTSGTFAKDYSDMITNNGLVIAGDRIVFKYNWEI